VVHQNGYGEEIHNLDMVLILALYAIV